MNVRELITMLGFKVDDNGIKKYNNAISSVKEKSSSLSKTMGNIGKVLVGAFAINKVVGFGKAIFDTTGEIEQYRVTLGTMIGDQEKANKIIHDLDYSPVSDFYGTASAIGGLQGMVTFGMQAEEASDALARLGDIAQGNGEAFKSLSLNMGQVFAKGKADATDLKQFVTQGFDVVGELSKMTGQSREEIEKSGVTYEKVAKSLKHITDEGGKYNGMLAKQSQTLPGLVKQFQSLFAAIREGIGMSVMDDLKDIMKTLLSFGRSIQENIVDVFSKGFKIILRAIMQVIVTLQVMAMRTNNFKGLRNLFSSIGNIIVSFVKTAYPLIEKLILFLAPAVDKIFNVVSKIFNFLSSNMDIIVTLLGVIVSFITIIKILNVVMGIANAIMAVNPITWIILGVVALIALIIVLIKRWDKIKEAIRKVADVFKKVWGSIVDWFKMIWDGIVNIIKAYINIIMFFWKGVFDFFINLWNGIVEGVKNAVAWIQLLFSNPIEAIKQAWNGIGDFFSNLWQGILDKFFGFKDKLTEGIDKIKSFFGFGNSDVTVNSKGNNPGVANSYASSIANNNNNSSITSNANMTVNVPAGTSAEQAQAIARQVNAQINTSWQNAISGGRSMIPSPEARR